MPLIFVWIYIAFAIVGFIATAIYLLMTEAKFNKNFEDFLFEQFFGGFFISLFVGAIWPLVVLVAIPVGPAWLIWKSQHTKAKIVEEAA